MLETSDIATTSQNAGPTSTAAGPALSQRCLLTSWEKMKQGQMLSWGLHNTPIIAQAW